MASFEPRPGEMPPAKAGAGCKSEITYFVVLGLITGGLWRAWASRGVLLSWFWYN